MNKIQNAKLDMYKAVISFCNQNQEVLASVPALQVSYNSFTDIVESITTVAHQKADVISGIREDKSQFRKSLVERVADVAAKVYAYAVSAANNELKEKVNFTTSDLLRLRDEELPGVCTNIVMAINSNLTLLAAYNVTVDTLKELNALLDQYTSMISRPRNAVSQRSAHVSTLKELFKSADAILKGQMDKTIKEFRLVNPVFYKPYKNNRIIIDPPVTPTQIRGAIVNSSNNEPVSGVTIAVLENQTIANTGEEGKFIIKPLAPGTYSIKVSKEGFQTKTITDLLVKLGQVKIIDLELSPAA